MRSVHIIQLSIACMMNKKDEYILAKAREKDKKNALFKETKIRLGHIKRTIDP